MNEPVATVGLARRSKLLAVVGAYFSAPAAFAYVQRPRWGVALGMAAPLAMVLLGRAGLPFAYAGYYVMMGVLVTIVVATLALAFYFARAMPQGAEPRWYNRWYHYVWMILGWALLWGFAGAHRGTVFGYESFRIPSSSMQPTLKPGDYITADFREDAVANIRRGDVVIYAPEAHPKERWIKRVIGLPGERVDVSGTGISIDGAPLREGWPTIRDSAPAASFSRVLLGPDQYYLMGDNRPNSEDSRYTGPVTRKAIVGKARTVWFHWMKPEGFDASRIGPIAGAPAR